MKHDRDIGKKDVLSDVKTAFRCTPAFNDNNEEINDPNLIANNFNQSGIVCREVASAHFSTCYITIAATTTETGDPYAVPCNRWL